MEFTFAASPWEGMEAGQTLSAAQALTVLAPLDETDAQDALDELEQLGITLDASTLPMYSGTGETATQLSLERKLAAQGDLMGSLEETDPLRMYLEELSFVPVCGDVAVLAGELAQCNRQGKNADAVRERLVNLLLSRVVVLAGEYTGRGVLLLDLIQEGSIGLWKATDVFQGMGDDFERISHWWIRFYMAKTVLLQARSGGLGQRLRTAMEDYRAVDERLLSDLGRNPTLEEIAVELHMSVEETGVVKKMLDNARLLAQAKQPEEKEESEEEEDQAVENTALFQMRQRILDLLSGLNETDQKLLTLRFGLEGGLPLNPQETGRRLGLTPEEVVAREAAALVKLREKQE